MPLVIVVLYSIVFHGIRAEDKEECLIKKIDEGAVNTFAQRTKVGHNSSVEVWTRPTRETTIYSSCKATEIDEFYICNINMKDLLVDFVQVEKNVTDSVYAGRFSMRAFFSCSDLENVEFLGGNGQKLSGLTPLDASQLPIEHR